jgi:hypothetical protein
MIWMCDGGGEGKCVSMMSTGFNLMQPGTSSGNLTNSSIVASTEEMGGDTFQNVRSSQLAISVITNLPEPKSNRIDSGKCMLLFLLDLFLQSVHGLLLPNVDREGVNMVSVWRAEHPTEEADCAYELKV